MIASFAACKSTKKAENTIGAIVETTDESTTTVMTKDTAIISMSKGGCFGKCPSYDFSINQYGEMYFKSKRYCKKEGIFAKQLGEVETKALFAKISEANLFDMQDEYKSMIPDMPLITISYNDGTTDKTVKGKLERPESLKVIQKELEALAQTIDGWVLQRETTMQQLPQYNFGELIVQLADNVLLPKWIKSYSNYDLTLVKQIAPNQNLYLLKYDQRKANPAVMKKELTNDPAVKTVSYNKLTTPREHE